MGNGEPGNMLSRRSDSLKSICINKSISRAPYHSSFLQDSLKQEEDRDPKDSTAYSASPLFMDSSSNTGPPAEVKIEEEHYCIGTAPRRRGREEAIPFKREVAPVAVEDFESRTEEPQPSTSTQVAEIRFRGDATIKEEPEDNPYDLTALRPYDLTAQVKWDPPADAAKRRSVPGGCNSKRPRIKRFPHL